MQAAATQAEPAEGAAVSQDSKPEASAPEAAAAVKAEPPETAAGVSPTQPGSSTPAKRPATAGKPAASTTGQKRGKGASQQSPAGKKGKTAGKTHDKTQGSISSYFGIKNSA